MKANKTRRGFAAMLTLVLLFGILPMEALAADSGVSRQLTSGSYMVTGGGEAGTTYQSLTAAMEAIKTDAATSGVSDYTIRVSGHDYDISDGGVYTAIEIPSGLTITLASGYTWTLTLMQKRTSMSTDEAARHFYVRGTLILNNIELAGSPTTSGTAYNGGVYVDGGRLEITNGAVITNCYNQSGGGVYVNAGELVMDGATIRNNKAENGGGVYVTDAGTFTLDDGIMELNEANNGGAVYVEDWGTSTMNGGSITTNTAYDDGGGVYINGGGKFTLTSGTVSANAAGNGGGVYAIGTFAMDGGTMESNTANKGGGGVYTIGTSTMAGGTMESNKANSGGGIYVDGSGTFIMDDGNIVSNTAYIEGGGVYAIGIFAMGGGTMEYNTAQDGGGIFTEDYSYENPVDTDRYQNISITASAIFNNNMAWNGAFGPPDNASDFTNRYLNSFNGDLLDNNNINYKYEKVEEKVTITYESGDGGSGSHEDVAGIDSFYTILTVEETGITREGYEFTGWLEDGGTPYAAGDTIRVTADITLTAQWRELLTVTYDDNLPEGAMLTNGAPPTDKTYYVEGEPVTVLDDGGMECKDSRGGMLKFMGWSADPTETKEENLLTKDETFEIHEHTTFYAIWAMTIIYYGNGNTTGTAPSEETAIIGSTHTLASRGSLEKTGHDFVGWKSQVSDTTRDANKAYVMPAYNVFLDAVWKSNATYSITYYSNRPLREDMSAFRLLEDYDVLDTTRILSSVDATNAYDSDGYVFQGWSTDAAATQADAQYAPGAEYEFTSGNLELYAVWYYELSYQANLSATEQLTHGTVPTDANSPYPGGAMVGVIDSSSTELKKQSTVPDEHGKYATYVFSGWAFTDAGVDSHQALEASLAEDEFYFTDGGTTKRTKASTGFVNSYDASFAIQKPETLYAVWDRLHTVTVEYVDTQGTPLLTSNSLQGISGTTDAITVPVITDYEFVGWKQDGGDLQTSTDIGITIPDEDTTITLVYEKKSEDIIPETYTVTYDGNGSTRGSMTDSTQYEAGATVAVLENAFKRSGYGFTGFLMQDGDGTLYASASDAISGASSSFTIASNVTLVAQWKRNTGGSGGGSTTYTVTYDANGGTGSHSDGGLPSSATYTVKAQSATGIARADYTFTGWNTKADGTGTTYAAADTFKISGNVTLYAQWKAADDDSLLNREDHMAYVIGYTDGTVKPTANISRAETATIYFRLLTEAARNSYWTTTNDYSDVSVENWFHNAVSTMSSAGIITGYTDGTFGGNRNITRAEFAAIAARFDSGTYTGSDKFSDISGHWAAEYINRAAEKGWITGYEDGSFKPNQYITRAEAMTLINRVLERDNIASMHADMQTWPDNPATAWYYEAVQEATNSHEYTRDTATHAETWTELTEIPDWAALETVSSTGH